MTKENEDKSKWCDGISEIIVDCLLDGGVVKKEDFKKAQEIVAEELFVRLLVNDYPPPYDFTLLSENNVK